MEGGEEVGLQGVVEAREVVELALRRPLPRPRLPLLLLRTLLNPKPLVLQLTHLHFQVFSTQLVFQEDESLLLLMRDGCGSRCRVEGGSRVERDGMWSEG